MSVIDNLNLRRDWDREVQKRDTQIPFRQWAYVTVVFAASDTDTDIPNPFPTINPDTIRWVPVELSAGAIVYRGGDGQRVAWTAQTLVLRATAACTARLLLIVERT